VSADSSIAQSTVVGVAVLLGLVVVSIGILSAGVGVVVQENAASADATRVATDLNSALRPVETTGPRRGQLSFTDGTLRTVDRDLRVLEGAGVRERIAVGALVFESGSRRVAFLAGAVVRGRPGSAALSESPPITASQGTGGVLVVGAPRLGGRVAASGSGGITVDLRTTVSHDRTDLGTGNYAVAVETDTPGPWVRHFEARGADVSRASFDDDGVESVVAEFPGERRGYLVVHDMDLEAGRG